MVLGVDLSLTATGICVSVGGSLDCHTINPGSRTGWERLGFIRDAVLAYGGDVIAVEGLSFGSHDTNQERAGLSHMIRYEWWRMALPLAYPKPQVIVVPPSTLKKFVCGAGNAEKSMMLREVWRRWRVEAKNDNESDAAGLCQIARCWCGEMEPETEAQRQVMVTLRTPKVKKAKKKA